MFAVKRQRLNRSTDSNGSNSNHGRSTSLPENSDGQSRPKKITSPTTLEIKGIPVHFPFKPYDCQKDYMTKVIDALQNSQNALLESPTGTGKTLCLLCASLAWQKEQRQTISNSNDDNDNILLNSGVGRSENDISNNALSQLSQNNKKSGRLRPPTILYASRTHSQISQVVKELRATCYRPKHAVLGSREQMCVNEKVSKYAAEGNSFVVNSECAKLNKVKKCRYRLNVDKFTPAQSNNIDTSSDTSIAELVMDIEDLVIMGHKKKVCPFYYTRNQIGDADLILLPYNYLFDQEARKTLSQNGLNWKNSVVIFDEAHNLESFASDAASFDLTGLDIGGCISEATYALQIVQSRGSESSSNNPKMEENLVKLKSIFLQFEDYLEKQVPTKGGSFSGDYIFEIWKQGAHITYGNHNLFITFVREISDFLMDIRGGSSSESSATPKLEHFVHCLRKTFAGKTESQCLAKAKAYRVYITPSSPPSSSSSSFNNRSAGGQFEYRTLSFWCFAPSITMHELAGLGPLRSILVTSGTLSPLPSYSMELGLPFPVQLENPHVIKPNQIHVRIVGKGVSKKELKATYDRRDNPEYITELGNTLVSLTRIIPGGCLIFFPSYGVMNKCIEGWGGPVRSSSNSNNKQNSGKYNNRQSFFQKRNTAKNSKESNRYSFPHAPNYYASTVGAPSVKGANTNPTTPWKRLLALKAIVLEPKSSADLKDAIAEFDKYLAQKKSTGCLLMGVCRGKISEGIDFADHRARAVVITGLPFAPYYDPKVQLKREFLDSSRRSQSIKPSYDAGFQTSTTKPATESSSLSGQEWYSQQAIRAVNQAVGRVIRHRFDYGSVLLLDSRFGEGRNKDGLSKWVRPHICPDEGIGKTISNLVKFYKAADKEFPANDKKKHAKIEYETDKPKQKPLQTTNNNNSRLMNEMKMMGTIAVVDKQSTSQQHMSYVDPKHVIKKYNVHDEKRSVANNTTEKQIKTHQTREPSTVQVDQGIASAYQRRQNQTSSSRILPIKNNFSEHKALSNTVQSSWASLEKISKKPTNRNVSLKRGISRVNGSSSASSSTTKKNLAQSNGQSTNTAKEFFSLAMTHLSEKHFKAIRTQLISMKKSEEKNDNRRYLEHAREIVDILLTYENVKVTNEGDELVGLVLLSQLIRILPQRFRSQVREIASRVKAKRKISAVKKKNKEDIGENGLNKAIEKKQQTQRLHMALKREAQLSYQKSSNPDDEAMRHEKMATLARAEEINKAAKLKVEEHLKIHNSTKKKDPPIKINANKFTLRQKPLQTNNRQIHRTEAAKNDFLTQDVNEIERCLRAVDKVDYVKTPEKQQQKQRVISQKSKFKCPICLENSDDPFIANCNHVACLDCWVKWLEEKKKGTCQVCRRKTRLRDLARVVFKKPSENTHNNKGVPLTQTLNKRSESVDDESDSEDEEEEELELIPNK